MKFLLLNHLFGELTGSEINVLQLSLALREAGHEADIGTFELRGPLVTYAEQQGIRVLSLLDDDGPPLEYDVIWAHHAPVLTHLIFRRKPAPCRLIFTSLSPRTAMESPPTYVDELPWILAHSPRNMEYLLNHGVSEDRLHYFPNFAPKAFFANERVPRDRGLKRMVVVSNHPPEEVLQMSEIARRDGVQVDVLGVGNPVFVDESVLPAYDLVVSIGKTVQYGFAQKVPVYCYDHFGGPGYLNADNLAKAERGNFCGLWFHKLTAAELYADIKSGHARATGATLDFLHDQARARFSLETNIAQICEKLPSLPVMDWDGLRQRHDFAGRLNDVYMGCLRQRLNLETIIRLRERRERRRRERWTRWYKWLWKLIKR